MNREMFKSVTLISLFFLCIVLTGQLMLSLSTDQQDSTVQALTVNKTFDIKDVFSPQSFIISFGGGIYTQNYTEDNSELWELMQTELITYLQSRESLSSLESIDESRWVELVKSRAVRFRMPFYMTMSDTQAMLDMDTMQFENDIEFNTILVSTHMADAIFFANEKDQTYYRMTGQPWAEDIHKMINRVEDKPIIEYRRVVDFFGLKEALEDESIKQNNSIFPITSMKVDFVDVTPEIDVNASDDSTLKSYANKAFGKQFNFVKKMRDVDQSIIYLYGYANKALRLGADGSIQYTEKIKPGTKLESLNLQDAIQLSLNYIDQYGGAPASLYLADYEMGLDDDENVTYILEFDYRIKDLPIISESHESGRSVRVEIIGNKVVDFSRAVYRYKDSFMLDLYSRALTINEVLDRNSNLIQTNYEASLPEELTISRDEIWIRILGEISHVELAYYLQPDKRRLYPVWKLDIGDITYYFRLYDGRLLNAL